MNKEYLKTLWMLRLQKMKKNEEHAVSNYETILETCAAEFGEEDMTVRLLTRLVKEERMHARAVQELIEVCRKTHPEFDVLLP